MTAMLATTSNHNKTNLLYVRGNAKAVSNFVSGVNAILPSFSSDFDL